MEIGTIKIDAQSSGWFKLELFINTENAGALLPYSSLCFIVFSGKMYEGITFAVLRELRSRPLLYCSVKHQNDGSGAPSEQTDDL
jgi:hypothetical protein